MTAPPTVPGLSRGVLARVLAAVTLAYTLFLVWATHHPRPDVLIGQHAPSDKTLHFLAYGALSLLAAGTLALGRRWSAIRAALLAGSLVTFAAADELTQPLFSRSAERIDWLYDCAGIAVGIVAVAAAVAVVRLVRGRQAQLGVGGR